MINQARVNAARALLQQSGGNSGVSPQSNQPNDIDSDTIREYLLSKQKAKPSTVTPTSKPSPTQTPQTKPQEKILSLTPYDLSNEGLSWSALGKSIANIGKSAARFGKDSVEFLNPQNAYNAVKQLPSNIRSYAEESNAADQSQLKVNKSIQTVKSQIEKNKTQGKDTSKLENVLRTTGKTQAPSAGLEFATELPKAAYQTVAPPAVQLAVKGEGTKALQSVAEDPYQLAPALLSLKGGLEKTKLGQTKIGKVIDRTISQTGQAGISTVTKPIKGTARVASTLAKYGTSQGTGLSPKTIETIINDPKHFSSKEMAGYSREAIGKEVHDSITRRINDLTETGKGYQQIRDSGQTASANPQWFVESMKKEGIFDQSGQVKPSKMALLTESEKAGVRQFIDTWGKDKLTADEYLDGRKFLDERSNWQQGSSSDTGTRLFREIRKNYDQTYGSQLKGLKELDAKYAPEAKLLRQVKKDYFNADGTLKDGALTKIANLTNEGRQPLLHRLEQIQPGIGKKIAVLNAIEDINKASGQKTGTYIRSSIAGAGLYTGNPAFIVASILGHPKIATQILRGYGRLRGLSQSAIDSITSPAKMDNMMKVINPNIKDVNVGLGIKGVSKAKPSSLEYRGKGKIDPKKMIRVNTYTSPYPKIIKKK